MVRINGTLAYGQPIKGVVQGTSIPLNDMIERSHTINIDLIPAFRNTINNIKLPVRVRSEIHAILEARLPDYLPRHNVANVVWIQ